eukprot:scaffold111348_cov21-Phaeocystis_antarctica.AAC.1
MAEKDPARKDGGCWQVGSSVDARDSRGTWYAATVVGERGAGASRELRVLTLTLTPTLALTLPLTLTRWVA